MDATLLANDSDNSRRVNCRALAARAIAAVIHGRSLDAALPAALKEGDPRDHSLIKALCYGVLRELRLLNHLASRLLDKPLKKNQAEVMQLILVGLYQIRDMRVADHAAVAETVDACNALRQPRARGLVNAVLRRYLREADALEADIPEDLDLRLSHPRWLSRRFREDWPDQWQSILEANQKQAQMTLRVNIRRHSPDAYLEMLKAADIDAQRVPGVDGALELKSPMDVHELPGFREGLVSVQDAAAQMAATLLAPSNGQRVLDACAAPGGKTAHLLEICDDLDLTALDQDAERLERVNETMERLGLPSTSCALKAVDSSDISSWWNGQPFDCILLDAPCSGSGVIRRHPDIKWLRRESDISHLAARQLGLLKAIWPTLKPGGRLLYATCSILKEEGEDVIDRFLEAEASAGPVPLNTDRGLASGAGRVILPGPMDGFFYCLLHKKK